MTVTQFNDIADNCIWECRKLLENKGNDYTDKTDRLSNFNNLADRIGVHPLLVWYVYFAKHIVAIETFVKDQHLTSEPIEARFTDAINYLLLGRALIEDLGLGTNPNK
jgi:hypothetical protein